MKITFTIRNRTQMWPLLWLLIVMPFGLGLLNEVLGLPYGVRYLMDCAWLLLLAILCSRGKYVEMNECGNIRAWILLFFLMTLAVFPIQYQSVIYYLWGLRNNFRFYVAFFAFAAFLTADDVEDGVRLFDVLFWVDIVVCLIQFFVLNIYQDAMGGLFSGSGGNSFNNIFFLIMLAKSLVFCLEKKEEVWLCILKCALALMVAAMAEMKFFFVEFIVVLILAVLFTNFTWRKVFLILGGVGVLMGCVALLTVFFPLWGQWFTFSWFLETATSKVGYTGYGDLNRLTAIPRINELWLKDWTQRIFGMGIGNCDTASFALTNTPFFQKYGDMHYSWISYAMVYLEMGYVGLMFYMGFFLLVYLRCRRIEKYSTGDLKRFCCVARIMAVMCMIISIYNNSLRSEAAYMAYFVLAIPFVLVREEDCEEEDPEEDAPVLRTVAE